MDYRRRMSVDVKDADVKKLKLGDTVTIICKGKVKELELGDKPEKPRPKKAETCGCGISFSSPSHITIELDSQRVESGETQISALLKGEEDSEEDD